MKLLVRTGVVFSVHRCSLNTLSSHWSFLYLIVMCWSKAHETPCCPLLYMGMFIILIFPELVVGDIFISTLPLFSSACTGMLISHAMGLLNVRSKLLLEGTDMSSSLSL